MNFNYTSLDLVIEKVNSIKIPGTEWNISELKEWTWEALSKIGTIQEFIEAPIEIEIVDGKGVMPTTLHTLHSVLEGETGYNMEELTHFEDFRILSYKLNAGYIFTDFDTGSVILQCYLFPVDEEGKPLIPDNHYYIDAVYSYIRMKIGEKAMWQGKIAGSQFKWLEQQWYYACPNAKNSSKLPTEDKAAKLEQELLKPFPNFYRKKNNNKSFNLTLGSTSR